MTSIDDSRKCFVTDCNDISRVKRLCRKHYKLYTRRGWDFPPTLPHPQCLVDGCEASSRQRGGVGWLCFRHAERFRALFRQLRKFVAEIDQRQARRVEEFWSRVTIPQDKEQCWLWNGYTNSKGYGWFHVNGVRWFVHRLSWKWHNGQIYRKLLVLHSCDIPLCVNPNHLRQGTFQDNAEDAGSRGRRAIGSRVGGALLDEDKVRYLRAEVDKGRTQKDVARELNVSASVVGAVCRKKAWRWVDAVD